MFGGCGLNNGDGGLHLVDCHIRYGITLHLAGRLCEVQGNSNRSQYQTKLGVTDPFGPLTSVLGFC